MKFTLAHWWSRADIGASLGNLMLQARHHLLDAAARALNLREATTVTAVERVADAHLTRGLYP